MARKYFVDKDHAVMEEYYDFLDSEEGQSPEKTEIKMKQFIEKDPKFLDPYLILVDLYAFNEDFDRAEETLDRAFELAMKIITDKDGNWPDEMLWGHLENRHIIRTLLNKAIGLWTEGENDDALELFRKLLRSNPNDNIGARHYILAIRLGMTFDEFETQMMSGSGYGYDGRRMMEFGRKMKDFPDEFDWWFEATEEN